MMWDHRRRILWLLAGATLIPIAVLSALGFGVLRQDRDAERQRQSDSLEAGARRLGLDIARWQQAVRERIARGDGLELAQSGPVSTPAFPLLYRSALLTLDESAGLGLADAEAAEYQKKDYEAAIAAYREAASRSTPEVRAAALLGLGGALIKRGDLTGALHAYDSLQALGDIRAAGQPAALLARAARCRALENAHDSARQRAAAIEFGTVLHAGGWQIDRPTFENYEEDLRRWGAPPAPQSLVARTEAAVRLWQSWQAGELPTTGARMVAVASQSVLAVWEDGPAGLVAWIATTGDLKSALDPLAAALDLRVAGHEVDGHPVFGDPTMTGLSLMPTETHLPFVLTVAARDAASAGTRDRTRRIVLIGSLSVAFVLMLAAGYGAYRATARELALAQQQADFVSAVSHEFRTPLTSMRHLTDLLASRSVVSDERRAHYYDLLTHETLRLHRMVESLLSFGRIEAGGYAWRLESIDAGELLTQVVDEFRLEPIGKPRQFTCEVESGLPLIRADADALSSAVWNLLENAAKYSAPDAPIRAFARRVGTAVHLGVGDRGIGIQPHERDSIFQKFVRGMDAKSAGIRGVGIGLALVTRIVEAHGGSIRVESEPGQGSTFTLVIPCIES